MPKVSVVLTSYNRPQLVTDAICSVREQTLADWELIICDDDSSPETLEAIRCAVGDDPRVTVLLRVLGPVTDRVSKARYPNAINEGLRHVTGDYVTYLCDDDYLYPEGLALRAKLLDDNPNFHVSYGRSRAISFDLISNWDTRGRPKAGRSYPKIGEVDPVTGRMSDFGNTFDAVRPLPGLDHNMFMHRRSCLDEIGGFPWWPDAGLDGEFAGDTLFLFRLQKLGHLAIGVNEPVVTKRYHGYNEDKKRHEPERE